MKNFSLKNIALVLAVLFGTAAAYSASSVHDLLDHRVGKGGTMKPAPRMATPSFDCDEPSRPQHFAAPKCDSWSVKFDKHGAKAVAGSLEIIMSSCGENITINGEGCIRTEMKRNIVQYIELIKLIGVLNCRFDAVGLLAVLEKCECREEREDACRPRKEEKDCHRK